MKHSHEASREAGVVTCYLDESGTHDLAPIAVLGGVLSNKSGFLAFDKAWDQMLEHHSIPPPLHMKDFRRPNGRLADITNEARRELFREAGRVIIQHKIYSIAATLTTAEYRKYFDRKFTTKGMGVYGTCFILCAHMNHLAAQHNNYGERIPFLMDSGNPYANHVRGAHAEMQTERWRHMNVGSLTFDDDEQINALQAADLIAWASRVKAEHGNFDNGYEPLVALFDEAHIQEEYPESAIAKLAGRIENLGRSGQVIP